MSTRRKIFLLLAGLPGLILILSVILYFSASKLINSESVKNKVHAYLLEKTGARITYGNSEFQIFPLPRIIIHQVNMTILDKAEGSAAMLRVYPRLLPLLRGRTEIAGMSLEAPHFTVRISEGEKKPSLEEIEEKVRSAVRYMVSETPGVQIVIQDGKLDLTKEGGAALSFDLIRSEFNISRKTVDMELTCRSNLSDDISLSLSVEADELNSKGTIRLTRLRADNLMTHFSTEAAKHLRISDAGLSVKFSTTGLRQVNASLETSVSGFSVLIREKQAALGDATIKGDIEITPDKAAVHIKEAKLSRPELSMSGQYMYNRTSGMITADLKGESVSVKPLRESALALGDDVSLIRNIFSYVQGGKIPVLHFHTSGKSMAELGQMKSIRIYGKMRDGIIHVAAKDLTFQDVDGNVVISGGILGADNVRASLGDHRCSGGKLRIGLTEKDALFHLDTQVKAVVEQLPALLKDKRLVKNESVLHEMDRLHDIRGNAEGRLILGDRLDSIHVKIAVDDMNFTARYEPVPFPLAVTGGKLFFDEKTVELADSGGRIGGSSFSGLTARLALADPYDLEITAGQLSISADEIYPWLTSLEKIKPVLRDVRSANGTLSVSSIQLRGPLYQPKEWKFQANGEAKKLTLDAAFFPGKAEDMSGEFAITQNRLFLKNMRTRLIDSPITVSGSVREFPSDIRNIDLSLQGEIGPKVTAWLTELLKLPKEMNIRAPFSVPDATLSFEREKKTAFSGRLLFGQATEVSLSAVKTPDSTTISNFTVKDRGRDCAGSAVLTKTTFDAFFRGALTSQTLNTIVTGSIFSDSALEGDFRTHIVLEHPRQSTAEGRLKAKNIPVPRDHDIPLVVRHIALEAKEQGIVIDSAEVSSGDMTFIAKGKISSQPAWFAVDMDVTANGITWETFVKTLEDRGHASQGTEAGALNNFPVRGTVRLNSDFFRYRQFRWEPFDANVSFDGKTVFIATRRAALCGVSTTGNVSINGQNFRLDISLSAKGLDLEPTILCLTDRNADITGTFEMDTRLKGEGKISELAENIEGAFTFSAKDGKILKAKRLDKTLELLNESENLKGQFPDLGREIISYTYLKIRGTVREQKVQIEEGILDSSAIGIQARGSIDLGNETLDLNAFVSPLKAVHQILKNVPILEHIPGNSLVSVPVKISGNMKDPRITFLSPSAIASESLSIVEKTIKLPVTLVQPIFPQQQNK